MLYIHIGLHKTGTSTIQKFMSENADAFVKHGVRYPGIGRGNNAHHALVAEVRKNTNVRRNGKDRWSAIREEVAAYPDDSVVLSSEGLHTLKAPSVAEIRKATMGLDVRIICYIRDMPSRWVSTYAERTKTGSNVRDFDKLVDEKDEGFGSGVQTWGETFGWDAMRIRSLDSRNLVNGNLINDFVNAIGLDYEDLLPSLTLGNDVLRNSSPGWKTIELLREVHAESEGLRSNNGKSFKLTQANKISSKIKSVGLQVAHNLGLNEGRAQYLTTKQFEQARELYSAQLDYLNERIVDGPIPMMEATSIPERPFLPDASHVPADERAAFHRETLFELVRTLAGEYGEKPSRRASKKSSAETVADGDDVDARGDVGADAEPLGGKQARRAKRKAKRQESAKEAT